MITIMHHCMFQSYIVSYKEGLKQRKTTKKNTTLWKGIKDSEQDAFVLGHTHQQVQELSHSLHVFFPRVYTHIKKI